MQILISKVWVGPETLPSYDLWVTQMLVYGSLSEFNSLEPPIQLPPHPDVPKRQYSVSKERLYFHPSPKSFAFQGFLTQQGS